MLPSVWIPMAVSGILGGGQMAMGAAGAAAQNASARQQYKDALKYQRVSDKYAGWSSKINARIAGKDAALWQRCRNAHRGFLVGMELLLVPARIAAASEFSPIGIDEELRPVVPERFRDPSTAKELTKALAPPPKASQLHCRSTPPGGNASINCCRCCRSLS